MNRLQKETSPYLKQHESNPVDWFPWGEEALQKSRAEDKPILLSVGYSSCHWCHVMAHECFENPQIAKLMNERFVCIKVDREERPDLDLIYQPVAQVFTRAGGWPLTVFLTPDLKPFYGGTYFPPEDRYGRPGFPKVLSAISKSYQENRSEAELRAEKITQAIRSGAGENAKSALMPEASISSAKIREGLILAAETLIEFLDPEHGGIGSAPKFPNASALTFLWRMSGLSWVPDLDRKRFREGVWLTLESMASGGLFDQIAGGFHRYSVDAEWVIPHFEKMLYDNGLLLKLYSEVLISSEKGLSEDRKALFVRVIRKTVQWLDSEMRSSEGLFYSALDADSLNDQGEVEEGAYYSWTSEDFSGSSNEMNIYQKMLTGLTEESRHVLTLQKLEKNERTSEFVGEVLEKLSSIRAGRSRPGLDDKILISWTALTLSGLCWASLAFESLKDEEGMKKTRGMALQAWNVIRKMAFKDTVLYSTIQKGYPKFRAYLDDEAFFLQATLDLARVDWKNAEFYFNEVQLRSEQVVRHFHDPNGFGFFFSESSSDLIHRPKSYFDQATPSGNGVMMGVLTSVESSHPSSDFAPFLLSEDLDLFQNAFGMSELLNSLLLKELGPVKVEGKPDLEIRAHPFCFWIREPESPARFQYCVGKACHLGELDPKTYF